VELRRNPARAAINAQRYAAAQSARVDVIKTHGSPCRVAAIWFHKLRIKLDASPRNLEFIPKL
jgi:hypothetical protein